MSYTTEHVARTLRQARESRSLTQRALGAKAGLPQSHISKIERGNVDLRLSSLIDLAHVLGLEMVLVPRKSLPVIEVIANRARDVVAPGTSRMLRELDRLQGNVADLLRDDPTQPELAALQRHAREIARFTIHESHLEEVREITSRVGSLVGLKLSSNRPALQSALERIRSLRAALVDEATMAREIETALPAYRLDEDDDG